MSLLVTIGSPGHDRCASASAEKQRIYGSGRIGYRRAKKDGNGVGVRSAVSEDPREAAVPKPSPLVAELGGLDFLPAGGPVLGRNCFGCRSSANRRCKRRSRLGL